MSWSLWKKKECIFCNIYFVWSKFFKHLYFVAMSSVLNKLSEYIYFYTSKDITLYTLYTFVYFIYFIKSSKAFSVSLKGNLIA